MALIVQKFGGSSVGTLDRLNHVANRIIAAREEGHDVVVVVSAMYGETDRLLRLANALSHHPNPRELDVLLSTGEQVSMALLSMALNEKKCKALSFTGSQIGILTDNKHGKARIVNVKTDILHRELAQGHVVIVAGFQGMNEFNDITTLGRGGSDTTAVAIAIAIEADECQIYTDVDGVYTTDPHILPEARLLKYISFEEMLEMSSLGAKVLQIRSVELASKYNMPIRVKSTFSDGDGSLVTFEEKVMQKKRLVSGIAFSREETIISLSGLPRQVGIESSIVEKISDENIEIDMIAQNTTAQDTVDFTFTVQLRDYQPALDAVTELAKSISDSIEIKTNNKVAKLSLVGIGMRSHTGVASTMFKALANASINIQMVTTSEIKISVVIDESQLENGIRVIHEAFNLDKNPEESEQFIE